MPRRQRGHLLVPPFRWGGVRKKRQCGRANHIVRDRTAEKGEEFQLCVSFVRIRLRRRGAAVFPRRVAGAGEKTPVLRQGADLRLDVVGGRGRIRRGLPFFFAETAYAPIRFFRRGKIRHVPPTDTRGYGDPAAGAAAGAGDADHGPFRHLREKKSWRHTVLRKRRHRRPDPLFHDAEDGRAGGQSVQMHHFIQARLGAGRA